MTRHQAGFTLLEVMITMAILSLAALVFTGYVGASGAGGSLARSSDMLKSALVEARKRAVAKGIEVRVELNLVSRTVHPAGAAAFVLGGVQRIDVTVRRQDLIQNKAAALVFYPDGTASGGAIALHGAQSTRRNEVGWLNGDAR